MVVNKYHLDWQVARLGAKQEKDILAKSHRIRVFFIHQKSEQNRRRALNWAKMTKLAYAEEKRGPFDALINMLNNWEGKLEYKDEDMHNFENYQLRTLESLQKDLNSRKWNFQYNKAPKSHVEFMSKLKEYINGKKEV